jgi:hypothetical protein
MQAPVRSLLDPKRMFAGILFLGIFTLAARNITDPDFWWHLRTGQYILETRSVPHADPFSLTRQGHPWIAHEWLSEVMIYSIYGAASWGGLIVGFAAVTSLTFVFLYLRCAGRPYVAGLLVLWAAFVCRPTWGVRPQTISVLLASLLLWMLERPNRLRGALLWVVPLTLLWANLHAGYSLGIALLVLFLLGGWLDGIFRFTRGSEVRAETRWLFVTLLLSLAVVLFNPNGWRLYGYPLATLHSTTMRKDIAEWFSPDFHRGEYLPLAAMLIAAVAFPCIGRQRMRPRTMLLVCVSAYAALQAVRLIPIFALIAAPFLAEQAEAFRLSLKRNIGSRESGSLNASRLALHGAIAIGLIVLACLQLRQIIKRQPAAEAATFPEAAVSFLHDHHQPGPLFNDYDWGGYLIWKLYPGDRVFIDGRADLYGDQFLDEYAAAYALTGDWQKPLNRWQIGAVVIPPQSALATALQATGIWKVLFRDGQATILSRSDPSMKEESAPDPGVVPSTDGESLEPAPEWSITTVRGPRN